MVDPESNCTPLQMVWETYSKMMLNDDPDFRRVLYYASREGGKTLAESVLEVLCMVHLNRDVIHLAAIEAQSKKAQEYVKGFLSRPYLRDYVVGDNQREVILLRYHCGITGENLTEKEFLQLPPEQSVAYEQVRNYARIIVATVASTNGEHSSALFLDEMEVMKDVRAYEEAQLIPSTSKGRRAITVLTSSRKWAFGLVQREIDNAAKTGLKVRHWNILDVTEACPASRHKPRLPRLTLYRSDEQLSHVTEDAYQDLTEDQKAKYVKHDNVYAGCSACRLYPMCQGNLATRQKSKSNFLKDIDHTIGQFRVVSTATAQAQLLCRKPSSEGLIFPAFDRDVHMLTAAQMAFKMTGDEYPVTFSKTQLVRLMKERQLRFTAGMDFGYSHDFAVTCGPVDGNRKFVIEVISMPELDPSQQLQICEDRIRIYDPDIYGDPENPQLVKVFKKAGWRMKSWKKTGGSVQGGIDMVRLKLRPGIGEPQLFFLKDDDGCEFLVRKLARYHWKLSPDGTLSNLPDESDDDAVDAMRYDIMNVFAAKGRIQTAGEGRRSGILTGSPGEGYTRDNWFSKIIEENAGPQNDNTTEGQGKAGGFKWNIG